MKSRLLLAGVLILTSASAARPQARYPRETRNAALRYWMAFAEMKDPPADKATQDLLEKTSAGQAAWDEARLGPILDANGEAIRTLQRAAQLPECDWGLEYSRGSRAAIPYVPKARVMARLNQLAGMREMAKGDSQAAVDSWLAGVRFSQHLATGGTLIFALVAKSALLPNLRALTTATQQGHLSAIQRKQVLATLNELRADAFNWTSAWGLEELTLEQFLGEVRNAPNPRAAYEAVSGKPMPAGAEVPIPADTARFREYMTRVQAALSLPPETAKAKILELETARRALPELVQRLIPSAQRVNDNRLEVFSVRKDALESLAGK